VGELGVARCAVTIADYKVAMLTLGAIASIAVGRHRVAVDVPYRAKLGVQAITGIGQNLVIGSVASLDARENLVDRQLAIVNRHTGLGMPAYQPHASHRSWPENWRDVAT